ncbi:MAG: peptidase, partial [Candidatus Aminicenantia bacterium]
MRGKTLKLISIPKALVWILFLLIILNYTSISATVPKPKDILGHDVGEDYFLASYEEAINYLKVIDEVSDRMLLLNMGKTTLGRDMLYAVVSSEENIKNINKYKDISRKLA